MQSVGTDRDVPLTLHAALLLRRGEGFQQTLLFHGSQAAAARFYYGLGKHSWCKQTEEKFVFAQVKGAWANSRKGPGGNFRVKDVSINQDSYTVLLSLKLKDFGCALENSEQFRATSKPIGPMR
jgi:hypothetical protein